MVISIACLAAGLTFVTGIINVRQAVALYVALPAGAIVFGLFMIFRVLEKEALLYDEEQQRTRQALGKVATTERKTQEERGCSCGVHEPAVMQQH